MSIEREILAISDAMDAALVANEAAAIAAFMADEWVYVGPTGPTPKRELIGWITSGRLAHHTMRVVGVARVVVHGDAVIVTARKVSTGAWDGTPYAVDEWITDVYVRDDGRWRCALSQKSVAE